MGTRWFYFDFSEIHLNSAKTWIVASVSLSLSSDQWVQLSADSRSVVSEVESGNSEYPPIHGNYDGTV